MSAQTQFFAMEKDIDDLLTTVESKGPLKYVRYGRYEKPPSVIEYPTFREIPNLSLATNEGAVGCTQYVLCAPSTTIQFRPIDGGRFYAVDQLYNPDSAVFSAGGLWNGNVLLYGNVGTVNNEGFAKAVMARFRGGIRKHFRTISNWYMGPEAFKFLKAGGRLTQAAQSPAEYNVAIPPPDVTFSS